MKIIVLAALITSVVCGPIVKTWTLDKLETVLHVKNYEPDEKPYLEEAYNTIIYSLFTNKYLDLTAQKLLSPDGSSEWTMEQLEKAIKDPTTNPLYLQGITESYTYLKNMNEHENKPKTSLGVYVRGMDISTWTLTELNEAIADPATDPQLVQYLETARTKLTTAPEFQNKNKISIVTRMGLVKKDKNFQPIPPNELLVKHE